MKKFFSAAAAFVAAASISFLAAPTAQAWDVDPLVSDQGLISLGPVTTTGFAASQIPVAASVAYPVVQATGGTGEIYGPLFVMSQAPTLSEVAQNPGICFNGSYVSAGDVIFIDTRYDCFSGTPRVEF